MLKAVPKPVNKKRAKNHTQRDRRLSKSILLKVYREEQRIKAFNRDNGYCVWCYFHGHHLQPAVEVHHVYGRGNWDTREEYEAHTSLLCLCRRCHGDFHDRGLIKREQFIELLNKINV